jgi:NADPH-dependent glutamate synthase beta subunit-like oxidoreductase
MPAWPGERDQAIRAGVNFLILTQPVDYVADDEGRVSGLRVVRTRLGAADAGGRRAPQPLAGSEHMLPGELVIEAIGQRISDELRYAIPGVRITEGGLVWRAAGSLATSRAGVFAAGDMINGGTTVVQAVAEGARAAREIAAWLEGPGTRTS